MFDRFQTRKETNMKKNLALVLALIMLVGALFSVIPMADGEGSSEATAKYVPEIAYANINYTDKLTMMFAVPAPASLGEGESVKLLFWNSRDDSLAFSYSDITKLVIEPETAKATIGGVEHLVFKYDALDATQMTEVVCVRPVVVKGEKAAAYGKLVDYSVVEYVASAKGEIEGIPALSNAGVIELLDNMLNFGGFAQKYISTEVYDFYANDTLRKLYVNVVINGANKGKYFAGFFKYDEEEYLTVAAPFFDGAEVSKVYDSEGKLLEDLDIYSEGVQIEMKDQDLVLTAEYSNRSLYSLSGEILGPDFEVNNHDEGVVGGYPGKVVRSSSAAITINGFGSANLNGNSSTTNYYWNSIKTIANPADANDIVVQLTATHIPVFYPTVNTFATAGLGDTIEPVFTIEMELGAYNNVAPTSSHFYIRHRAIDPGQSKTSAVDIRIFKIISGTLYIANAAGAYNTPVLELPKTGLKKVAIVVDPTTEMIYAYAEDDNGQMNFVASESLNINAQWLARQTAYKTDPVANSQLSMYDNVYDFFMQSKLELGFSFGANTGKDKFDDLMTADKKSFIDMSAVKDRAEKNYSFLMDNYSITLGRVYE